MTIRIKILAAGFALALAAPAVAAPLGGGMMMSGRHDIFHDHSHRPPVRAEHRPPMPHGHYRWRDGAWNWRNGVWVWGPGLWIRF